MAESQALKDNVTYFPSSTLNPGTFLTTYKHNIVKQTPHREGSLLLERAFLILSYQY